MELAWAQATKIYLKPHNFDKVTYTYKFQGTNSKL